MRYANIIWPVFVIALLAGLFWLFSPDVAILPSGEPVKSIQVEQILAEPQGKSIEIKQGAIVSGPALIRIKQGETIRLAFLSDEMGELHLHGYDLTVLLQPSEPAELVFTAEYSGRFEYELHRSGHRGHAMLGVIEVMPK